MTLRDASKQALEIMRIIQSADLEHGIRDPDLADVIDALAHALHPAAGSGNRWGFSKGQRLRVSGGKLDGETVLYDASAGGNSVYALHLGARVSVQADRLETV